MIDSNSNNVTEVGSTPPSRKRKREIMEKNAIIIPQSSSKQNTQHKVGDDDYYHQRKQEKTNYMPIMVVRIVFDFESKEKFDELASHYISTIQTYKKENFPKTKDLDDVFFESVDKLSSIQLKINGEKQKIVVCMNHAEVGGSHVLKCGTKLFKGQRNDLVVWNPDDQFPGSLFFLSFMTVLVNLPRILWKKRLEKLNSSLNSNGSNNFPVISVKKNLDLIKRNYYSTHIAAAAETVTANNDRSASKIFKPKSKYLLLHSICSDIINSTENQESLVCWLPIGFADYPNCPGNNVGLLIFTFKKNMSVEQLQSHVEFNKFQCIGSKNIIDNYNPRGKTGYKNSNYVRQQVDVVITLWNLFEVPDEIVDSMKGFDTYFGKECDSDNSYPVYVCGGTFNQNKCYLTYSVKMKDFNVDKCLQLTDGTQIQGDIFANRHLEEPARLQSRKADTKKQRLFIKAVVG